MQVHQQAQCPLFRLPRELRDNIYIKVLVQQRPSVHQLAGWTPTALCVSDGGSYLSLASPPPLLAVCRRIREEGDKIYWGENSWHIFLDVRHNHGVNSGMWPGNNLDFPRHCFTMWHNSITRVGGLARFRALRNLTLELKLCDFRKGCSSTISIQLTQRGLEVQYSKNIVHIRDPIHEDAMGWHIATTEMRRKDNGWEGEGIIDFFTSQDEFWTEWWFSYPGLTEAADDQGH